MFTAQLIRYIFVGLYNTFLGYILYSLLLFVIENYTVSYFLAYIIVSVKSYFLYKKYVFLSSNKKSQYFLFTVGQIIQYSLGSLLLLLFVNKLFINEYAAGFYILPVTVVVSFFYNKYIFTKGHL